MEDIDMESKSSGSDSDSDMEEEINEEKIKEEIKLYKEKISMSETDYDAHVNLIKALKKLGELEDLREARTNFCRIYPLSAELWTQWLADEQSICTTDEERSEIIELFEKAVKDYISVPLWVEYILFMLKGGNNGETREVCEKALTSVGIHFGDGILVWQAVLLVEQQIFASLQAGGNDVLITEQKKRVQNLYRRQARVPLLTFVQEEFLSEVSEWFDGQVDTTLQNDLKKSLKISASLLPFETALGDANTDIEKLEAYRKCLDFARKNSSPTFIQITYERAVADLCLNAGLWEEYVKFAMEQFPYAGFVVLPICERSQRNCPWSAALCCLRMQAIQTYNEDGQNIHYIIKECLEKSLSSGIQNKDELNMVWMSYLVFLRIQINWEAEHEQSLQTFREACHQASDYICDVLEEPDCETLLFLARIEAYVVKNIENVRTVFNENILRAGNNYSRADLWLDFIGLERSCGDTKHARKLFRKALERVWNDVEDIGKEFLKFEQEVGTLETVNEFNRKYKDRFAIVQKRRLEEATKLDTKKMHTAKYDNRKSKKETFTSYEKPVPKVAIEIRKKVKPEPPQKTGVKRPTQETEFRAAKKSKVESVKHGESIKHDHSNDYRSVFLSNLDYNSEQDEILPIFEKCGEVESFRLVRDFKGRSKGFGYLVFKNASSVKEAINCDRTPLGSRPIYVSHCDNTKSGHSFQYATGIEKEKLFIRGLPVSMQEPAIKQIFSAHGKIKELRVATHRNGFSKGLCYITYFTSNEAEKTRAALDGTEIEGRKITVQISNPSGKNLPSQSSLQAKFHNEPETSRSGNIPARGQRERLSFVPRSISTAKANKKESGESLNGNEMQSVPKTNEEFRKMLLK